MRLNDPDVVRREYATEAGLSGRKAIYASYPTTGRDAKQIAFHAIAAIEPRSVLEAGCGTGEFAERIKRELGCEVVAIDQSERMVALTRALGVDAHLGDVQALPFEDRGFDCAFAGWMLYHVADVDRALSELARVLRPGGRLVAVTNALDHLQELRALVGRPPPLATPFSAENGEALLQAHFADVILHDAGGTLEFPDREAVLSYVQASTQLMEGARVPLFDGSFVVTIHPVVFVADKAA